MCLTPQHRCRCRPFCPVLFYLLLSTLFYNSHPSHYRSSLKKICASACGQFRIAINSSRNSSNRNNKPNTIESMLIQWLAMELIHFVKAISNQSSDNLISFSISATTTTTTATTMHVSFSTISHYTAELLNVGKSTNLTRKCRTKWIKFYLYQALRIYINTGRTLTRDSTRSMYTINAVGYFDRTHTPSLNAHFNKI